MERRTALRRARGPPPPAAPRPLLPRPLRRPLRQRDGVQGRRAPGPRVLGPPHRGHRAAHGAAALGGAGVVRGRRSARRRDAGHPPRLALATGAMGARPSRDGPHVRSPPASTAVGAAARAAHGPARGGRRPARAPALDGGRCHGRRRHRGARAAPARPHAARSPQRRAQHRPCAGTGGPRPRQPPHGAGAPVRLPVARVRPADGRVEAAAARPGGVSAAEPSGGPAPLATTKTLPSRRRRSPRPGNQARSP